MVPTHQIRPPGTKKHVDILKTTPFSQKIQKMTEVYEVVILSLFPFRGPLEFRPKQRFDEACAAALEAAKAVRAEKISKGSLRENSPKNSNQRDYIIPQT